MGTLSETMEKILGKNWITKLGGIIGLLGGIIALLPKSLNLPTDWAPSIIAIGTAVAGFGAKDFNTHSTTTEVKTATEEKKVETADKIAEIKAESKEQK